MTTDGHNLAVSDINTTVRLVLYVLFFASGISGLVYEIIWMRKLSLIFGNTVYGTSTVLTTFMGGLALGSFWLGRVADRRKNLVSLYALIELGIGFSVLLLMFFFLRIMDGVYVWSFRILDAGPVALNTIRFLMAIVILIIPTTLMGGTLPVMSKIIVRQNLRIGLKVGNLYALNTFGAAVGAFATGFLLIKNWGETTSTFIAIAMNVFVAIVILALNHGLARSSKIRLSDSNQSIEEISTRSTLVKDGSVSHKAKFILMIFGLAGFASLAYEVVWTRALLFFVSSRVYSFSIILTTFLTGIMLGSFVFSQIVDKLRRPFLKLGLIEIVIGLTALITIPTIQHLQNFNMWLSDLVGISDWTSTVILLFCTCAVVLIVPTFLMGAAFPLVTRLYTAELSSLGKKVGNIYSLNTLGAIIGSFITGFFILPQLGITASILVLSSINVVIGIWAGMLETGKHGVHRPSLVVAVCAIILFGIGGWTFYQTNPIVASHPVFKGNRIPYYKDTPSGSLSVLESIEEVNLWGRNVRFLNINGNNTAHTTFADIIVHKMLAHVPMLMHTNPQDVLVIGFGFGSTSRSILYYEVERVDCVELIAEEKETAQYFLPENQNVLDHPKFNLIVNDGRNFLLVSEKKYDVISFNAIDPKMSPTLYTRDFYQLCKQRLDRHGVIAAWLPFYGLEPTENLSLIRSFLDVFPHASLWYCNPEHFVLLGSNEPMSVKISEVQRRFLQPKIQNDLHEVHLQDLRTFLATCIMDESGLGKMVQDVPLNTDLNPVVEFSRVSVARTFAALYDRLIANMDPLPNLFEFDSLTTHSHPPEDFVSFATNHDEIVRGMAQYENAVWGKNPSMMHTAYQQIKQTIEKNPQNAFNLLFFVDWLQHQDLTASLPLFQKAGEIEPQFAKAQDLVAMALLQQGDIDGAIASFHKALAINPNYVSANFNLGLAYGMKQNWSKAIDVYQKVLMVDENFYAHSKISNAYAYSGDLDKAIYHCKKALALDPHNASSHFNLGLFLEKQGKMRQAIKSFEKGLKYRPNDQKAKTYLENLRARAKS